MDLRKFLLILFINNDLVKRFDFQRAPAILKSLLSGILSKVNSKVSYQKVIFTLTFVLKIPEKLEVYILTIRKKWCHPYLITLT